MREKIRYNKKVKSTKTTKTILIVFAVILLLSGIVIAAFIIFKPDLSDDFYSPSQEGRSEDREEIETEPCVTCSENSIEPENEILQEERHLSGNVVWWDQSDGYNVLVENSEKFDSISPFWYAMERNGVVKKTSHAENSTLINFCKTNGIEILPTFTNGHTQAVSTAILSNEEMRTLTISNIISKIETFGYDGIQLDFEDMKAAEKDLFSEFVQLLATELHSIDKKLITTVHPKISDEGVWAGSQSQDWEKLGEYSDYVMIMAYDYHWSSSEAGEIAPISWIRNILSYAVTQVSNEKILLGINFYGYNWVGSKAAALDYSDVLKLINTHKLEPELTLEKEQHFTYESDGAEHVVYYADRESVEERLKLLDEYDIGGISIWRLGNEDPEIYETLLNYF